MPNRPITSEERQQWSTLGHMLTLEAISTVSEWTKNEFAFHGGTSLHLSWNSPRFSEDLDFLLNARCADRLAKIMQRVKDRVQDNLINIDPGIVVSMTDKSRDRLADYRLSLSKPGVLGSVMIKAEFWKVEPLYLTQFQSASKTPAAPPDMLGGYTLNVSAILPAAKLGQAYLDKLTAFATRPHLKWRDLFDFWWITNHAAFEPPADLPTRLEQNLSAYNTVDNLPPAAALRLFTTRYTKAHMLDAAEKDLKPFLAPAAWKRMWPDTVEEMIDVSLAGAIAAAEAMEERVRHGHGGAGSADDPGEEDVAASTPDAPGAP